jgi:hypothetical protein
MTRFPTTVTFTHHYFIWIAAVGLRLNRGLSLRHVAMLPGAGPYIRARANLARTRSQTMKTRAIAIALSALMATTAVAPMASAHEWQGRTRYVRPVERHHDNTAAILGLGLAAVAGFALLANSAQAQPVYAAPAPAYVPEAVYAPQPVYAPQAAYAQPAPTCTTINGAAACIGPDGNWQYVR